MPRIAYLVSSAREIDLRDSSNHPTGYWAEEALKAYERFVAAGADVVVITPDGNPPVADPYSLESIFHYPDQDRDYFASVYRTFHQDPDDIRITLHHSTEQQLMAARRIAYRLVDAGSSPAEAHELVSRAAKIAWQQDRLLVDVMLRDGLDGGLSEETLREAVADLESDAEAVSAERPSKLDDIPDVRRLLGILHAENAVIASLCHGPALLLAAPERVDGQWLFEGYRLTSYTDEEEDQNRIGKLDMPWYLDAALKNAGAVFDDAPFAWASHVVVDRNLITGQNPNSSEATADAVLKALHL